MEPMQFSFLKIALALVKMKKEPAEDKRVSIRQYK